MKKAISTIVLTGLSLISFFQKPSPKLLNPTNHALVLQRDWARNETYVAINNLAQRFAGGYGIGIQYAREMLKH